MKLRKFIATLLIAPALGFAGPGIAHAGDKPPPLSSDPNASSWEKQLGYLQETNPPDWVLWEEIMDNSNGGVNEYFFDGVIHKPSND